MLFPVLASFFLSMSTDYAVPRSSRSLTSHAVPSAVTLRFKCGAGVYPSGEFLCATQKFTCSAASGCVRIRTAVL